MKILTSIFAIMMLGMLFSPAFAFAQTLNASDTIIPKLQVEIPGLTDEDFEGSVIIGSAATKDVCAPGNVCITTISEYLNAVFKFGVTAGIIFSIVIIMIGGIEYMVGSAVGQIERAKTHIKGAVIGLALLLSVTAAITFINPNITGLISLDLKVLTHLPGPPPAVIKETSFGTSASTDLINAQGEIVKGGIPVKDAQGKPVRTIVLGEGEDNVWMATDVIIRIQNVAEVLAQKAPPGVMDQFISEVESLGFELSGPPRKLEILKTYIKPEKAAIQFYTKCVKENCAQEPVCNPFPENSVVEGTYQEGFKLSSGVKEQTKDMEEGEIFALLGQFAKTNTKPSCPFQSGYAVAAICWRDSIQRADAECQFRLEVLMKSNGFCRSYHRPWMYEFDGHQVLDSTMDCDWIPGTMVPAGECTDWVGTVTYASGKSSKCAENYANEDGEYSINNCIDPLSNDPVDLTTGKCL